MTISINPPPRDKCCECCGRNVKVLKPFGKEGDPLNGNFEGALLIKTFRAMAKPPTKEQEIKWIELHGIEDYEMNHQLSATIGASWECRDCMCLNEDEWWKVKRGG